MLNLAQFRLSFKLRSGEVNALKWSRISRVSADKKKIKNRVFSYKILVRASLEKVPLTWKQVCSGAAASPGARRVCTTPLPGQSSASPSRRCCAPLGTPLAFFLDLLMSLQREKVRELLSSSQRSPSERRGDQQKTGAKFWLQGEIERHLWKEYLG